MIGRELEPDTLLVILAIKDGWKGGSPKGGQSRDQKQKNQSDSFGKLPSHFT